MWLRWVVSNLVHHVTEDKMRSAVEQARQVVEPALRRQLRPEGERGGSERSDGERSGGSEAEEPTSGPAVPFAGPCDWVVLFAVGLESGGFVDRMTDVVTTRCATFVERVGQLDGRGVVVCESGMGGDAAAQATLDVIQVYQPQWVVSAGFAAALVPELRRGHVLMADSLVDASRESLDVGFQIDPAVVQATPSLHVGSLLTIDRLVRNRDEKLQLAADFDAVACDMETFSVAQVCRRAHVRFLSVRIVSDQLDDKLPVELEHLLDQNSVAGKLGAATRALFQRPGSVKDMWKLKETALRASDRLAKFLVGVLPQLDSTVDDNVDESVDD